MSEGSGSARERQIEAVRLEVAKLIEAKEVTVVHLASKTGLRPPTIRSFVKGTRTAQDQTVDRLGDFLTLRNKTGGFIHAETYLNIASGLNARTNDQSFSRRILGKHQLLRMDLFSNDPVVSTVTIATDRNRTIKYAHEQYVRDDLNIRSFPAIEEGFVFNCGDRIFFMGTSTDTQSIVSMVFQYADGPIMSGIVLSVTNNIAKLPYATKVLLRKLDPASDMYGYKWPNGRSTWDEKEFDKKFKVMLETKGLIGLWSNR